MAIYNPKRARELEAAARLAESQRQRELAKGQREQRTTEQILGLVEGLIGAAPQAAQAFEQSQAERVLAGERPLEMEEAKDPFTSLGRFLFEPGIQRKVQQMAPERLAKGREVMKPLTTQEVTKGLAGKYEEELGVPLPPQMGAERAARDVMERVPAAKFVPEAQREALAVGDVQRVQEEQEAKAREKELFDLQKKEIKATAEVKEAQAKKFLTEAESKKQQVAPAKMKELASALAGGVRSYAQDLKQQLNSTDPMIRGKALDDLMTQIQLESATIRNADGSFIDPNSPVARAAASEAQIAIMEELELPPLNAADVGRLSDTLDTIDQVANLVKRRGEIPDFTVKDEQILAERLARGIPKTLGLKDFADEMRKLGLESELTNEQLSWLHEAMILRGRLTTQEFKGTGSISDFERRSIMDYVLTPIATYDQFKQRAFDTLRNVSSKYSTIVTSHSKLSQVPDNLIKFAQELDKATGKEPGSYAFEFLKTRPSGAAEKPVKLDEPTAQKAVAEYGKAPEKVITGLTQLVSGPARQMTIDFFQGLTGGKEYEYVTLIPDPNNPGQKKLGVVTGTADQLFKMLESDPERFSTDILQRNPVLAKEFPALIEKYNQMTNQ